VVRRGALVVLSAAAYAGAFPPWSQSWLAFVALVPFLWALDGPSARGGAVAGFVWGTACMSFFGYWVPVGMSHYWLQPGWFGFLFALGVAAVYGGSCFALFGGLYAGVCARFSGAGRVLVTAALYVSAELLRAHLLTGHPWLLLGYAAVPYRLWPQMADLGGVYLLSFGIVTANASLVEFVRAGSLPERRVAGAMLAAALVVPLAYGALRVHQRVETSDPIRVAIVQGNLDLGVQWRDEYFGLGLDRYLRLSEDILPARPQLVVWPEAAMTFFLATSPSYLQALVAFARRGHTELVTGGPYAAADSPDGPFYNSAFLVDAHGIRARYDKLHLLPFAEYFPLRTIRFLRRHFERVRSFVPGAELRLLPTAAGLAGMQLCFEAIFPGLVRRQVRAGAEILLNLSNDAWLQSWAGGEQHLLMVRLRAIETRRWMVRSTTTGVSAFIDSYGNVRGRIEADRREALVGEVYGSNLRTPYVVVGDLFAFACAALVAGVLLGVRRRSH
jgi:apolipoprotein N-acyltransferase